MNERLHRVVFNAARGLRMAVQETARSAGKAKGATPMLVVALLAAASAQAQIVGAPNVPGNLRPTVLMAPNGVPLVQIQTPSAAGVSRNLFNQFDVQRNGVILNNSRVNAQTQLGGFVQGNPWLANGPARIILNEVVSGNPTQLRGFIEVGGQKAEVVIANPAGISVDGSGFINASRATLTTGTPQLNAFGGLDGYVVRGGTVSIDGAGLDLSRTDYAAILARAVQVNAGIWANELKVVTGANQVSADHGQISPTTGSGTTPVFALDVAQIGGMYANKIMLIGTEAGLGARNAGTLQAANGAGTLMGAGQLVVTAAGRLENKGTLEGQSVQLTSAGDIDNRGGTIRQTSGVGLTMATPRLSNTAGGVIGAEPVPETSNPGTGTGTGGSTNPGTPSTGGGGSTGTAPSQPYVPPAPGSLTAAGAILNDGGRIYASGAIALQTPQISNNGGTLTTADLTVSGPLFSNAGGTLNIARSFSANVERFDNIGGHLHAGSLQVNATGDLINQDGTLSSDGDIGISAGGLVNNTRGTVNAGANLTVGAGALTNSGSLRGANDAAVHLSGALINAGSITAGRHTTITAGSLQASNTSMLGAGIQADGKLGSAGDLRVTTTGALVATGTHLGAGNAVLQGASIDLSSSSTSAANIALTATQGNVTTSKAIVVTPGTLSVTANAQPGQTLVNNAGTIASNGSIAIAAGSLNNTQGTIAATTTVNIQSGALDNHAGLIQSGGAMVLDTHGQALTNTHSAGHATGQGGITSDGTLTLDSGTLNNTAGFIGAKHALLANTQAVTNSGGGIVLGQSTVAIDTHGATYDNRGGQTQAVGDLRLDAGAIHNAASLIRSLATTTLNAATIDNSRTSGPEQGIEGQNVAITTASLTNAAGAIRADANTTLTSAGSIDNSAAGLISAGDTLSIVDPNAANPGAKTLAITNTGSTLLAGKAFIIDAGALSFDGKLLSQGDMHLALNQDAVIAPGSETIANRNLSLGTSGNLTHSGRLAAGNDLLLAARHIDNTATGDIQGHTTTLSASETVTNRGVIDGAVTRIDADTLTNIGSGRIYGDQVSIGAVTLHNLAETLDGVTRTATIAARQRLDIGATTLNNRDGASISSDGDLFIGAGLDAAGHATGAAATLNNHASTIEATRNADIKTAVLNNTNGGVTWSLQPGASEHVVEYMTAGSSQRWQAGEVLFGFGGYILNPTGWNGWTSAPASDPLAPGANAGARLLLPSPDYPLARFAAYYAQSPAHSADRSYQSCGIDFCETVALPGAWYAIGDPIWATFGVTPPAAELPAGHPARTDPHITVGQEGITISVDGPSGPTTRLRPFDHPVTQAEYDQWQAYRQAHTQLDEATLRFIHAMTGVVRGPDGDKPPRFHAIYDAFDYTVSSSTPVLQSSAPGKILAGGAMAIQVAGGTNEMSRILAGGALSVTGGTIANVGLTVDAPVVQTGTAIHSYVNEHSLGSDERVYQFAPYNLTTHATVTLAAARQEGNAGVAGSGQELGAPTPGRTGTATQGGGGVQGGARVNPIVEVLSAVAAAAAAASLPAVVRTSTPSATVPTASLFATHPESTSRYLIETDPRFANYRQWLSSDYLLHNLGLDPSTTQKRLGDGFYEQRLISEQVAQLTGYRYLDGFASDDAQYTALMNAGVTFAQQYGLRPGIALTAAQMAQLTSDIVWLVEQEVTLADGSTQRVLVPQVYVRVKQGDIDGSGALLTGSSVDLRLAGDLVHSSGTIAGRNAVLLSAENIHNLGGRITGQDVGLIARTDLNVIGGVIDAQNSLSAIAGRDIHIVTTTRDSRSSAGMLARSDAASGVDLHAVTLDRVAGLYATNPGGRLMAVAGRDMNLAGAEVKSAGDASLSAGRDMNLDSITTGRSEDIRWSSRNAREGQQSRETGSIVSGAGNVSLTAGRDLAGRAATLSAGESLSLDAADKLTLYAGENQASADTRHATKSGMRHYSLDADSQETTLARTTLAATDIQLRSGGDMTLGAIEANAERLDINAGGRLALLTQSTTSAQSQKENDGDAAWVSASGGGRVDETSRYNRFNVATLNIKADGGIKAQLGQNDSLALLGQQPGMAWVNQLTSDPAFANSVEWQRLQEEHKKWAYSQTSLGPVAALVVSVVAGMVAAPVAARAGAAAGSAAAGAGVGTTVSAGVGSAVQAGVTALASRAAVSFVNNNGDLGAVLKELGSSEGVKSIATAMVTAGVIEGLSASDVLPQNLASASNGSALFTDQLQRQLINGVATSLVRSAIKGTSLEEELRSGLATALLNTVAAQGAFEIGEAGPQGNQRLDAFTAEVAHAILGCAVGAGRASAGGGSAATGCSSGAVGAVVGNLGGQFLLARGVQDLATAISFGQLFGGIAGALVGGDASSATIGAQAGGNAVENNECQHTRMCGSDSTRITISANGVGGQRSPWAHTEIQIESGYELTVLEGQAGTHMQNSVTSYYTSGGGGGPGGNNGRAFAFSIEAPVGDNMAAISTRMREGASHYGNTVVYGPPAFLTNSSIMAWGMHNSNSYVGGIIDYALPDSGIRWAVQDLARAHGYSVPGMENPLSLGR